MTIRTPSRRNITDPGDVLPSHWLSLLPSIERQVLLLRWLALLLVVILRRLFLDRDIASHPNWIRRRPDGG